jgi:hypothetical protein
MGVIVTVSPSREVDGRRAYVSRGPLFDAAVGGRTIATRCVTPMLDSARVLLAEGADPAARLVMRHAGSEVDAVITTIGCAAGLTVRESDGSPRFRPYEDAASLTGRLGGLPRRGFSVLEAA